MNKIYQLLSICQKGRNLISGEYAVKQSVIDNKTYLVIISNEASDNTKKLFKDKCSYRGIPYKIWGTSEDLGKCMGKEYRVVVGVTEKNLAIKILNLIEQT
ncbi:MAG: hypothetical protein BEN19_08415 [Epulopiscium sp. Nuni2H_MBin003]|nr:MAG: hypothetical protein BEN19_08415 [Epulopiscium sp. Nuni2H_MBin003]